MAKAKSKKQVADEFTEAMFQFIYAHSPSNFNMYGLANMLLAGRVEEATEMLNSYKRVVK